MIKMMMMMKINPNNNKVEKTTIKLLQLVAGRKIILTSSYSYHVYIFCWCILNGVLVFRYCTIMIKRESSRLLFSVLRGSAFIAPCDERIAPCHLSSRPPFFSDSPPQLHKVSFSHKKEGTSQL